MIRDDWDLHGRMYDFLKLNVVKIKIKLVGSFNHQWIVDDIIKNIINTWMHSL
jgi:hypothetical protein